MLDLGDWDSLVAPSGLKNSQIDSSFNSTTLVGHFLLLLSPPLLVVGCACWWGLLLVLVLVQIPLLVRLHDLGL